MDPFVFKSGKTARDAHELLTIIQDSSVEDVEYHLDGRNDYAVWIHDVLGDISLANKVNAATDRQELIKALSPNKEKHTKEFKTAPHDALTANILFKEYVKGALLGFVVGLIVAIIIYNVV